MKKNTVMEFKITKDTISNFTYEIIERIIRFVVHLEEIENQFYKDNENKKVLINNYKGVLYELLSIMLLEYNNSIREATDKSYYSFFNLTKDVLNKINKLHTEHLKILPRPSEPVELTRFERVIHKQIVQLTDKRKKRDITISSNERIGEEAQGDYLYDYKEEVTELFKNHNIELHKNAQKNNAHKNDLNNNGRLYITIPRIDASNTFRWPSLIHEMCHSLFIEVKFKGDNQTIESDFLEYIDGERSAVFNGYFDQKDNSDKSKLYRWLEECWCDLFACILIGPSFYFSQFLAFMNEEYTVSPTHPPHAFRLDLIESIIKHRFPILHKNLLGRKYLANCESLNAFLQSEKENGFLSKTPLTNIYNAFNSFFTSHFFSVEKEDGVAQLRNNPRISKSLENLVNKYVRIYPEVVTYLSNRLQEGLPIPSVKIKNYQRKYEEFPTYVQEIFLASWLSRCDGLVPNIIKLISAYEKNFIINNTEDCYVDIKKIILRHDQAVLKSIQVSEWFDFLIQEKRRPKKMVIFNSSNITAIKINKNILVDKEIEQLILQDELKIIPMMYWGQKFKDRLVKQVGTTSIDIRLGTSFQVFYPNQYGIIDFAKENNSHNSMDSSKRINLDFIEGITIMPGQFLLGHSMEYIKLPDYICGNLDGRSSFARLGIEIHMTAGFIDPGFEGVITFEIYNAGPSTVMLYPGMRIGQLRFEKNSIPKERYAQKHTVKYKGLLEHDLSRQNKDFEVELIKEYYKVNK